MGRHQGYETQQFKGGRDQLVRKHCLAAYGDKTRNDNPSAPKIIMGRSSNYPSHLKRCQYYQEAVRRGDVKPPQVQQTLLRGFVQSTRSEHSVEDVSSTSSVKRQRYIREYFDNVFTDEELEDFHRLLIQFQADNYLPDQNIHPSFIFLNKACVSALPKRKDMGRILDKFSTVEEEGQLQALSNRLAYSGGRLNFLSDVWQNIAKVHLLGCMLALFGTIVTYGLFATGSRHDGIAIAQQMENVIKEIEAKGWRIGAVVTDNAGQCGRARRILALRHTRIAYVRCFAHDINNLVKAVLNSAFRKLTKTASRATVTLNTSSSKWLVRAQAIIIATYGKSLGFINLCETRWNSMQGCFASLLRVRNALLQFAIKYDDDGEFPDALRVFSDPNFWRELVAAEGIIRPLSNVSYKLQRDENTLADVVVSYRDIYRGFLGDFDNLELTALVDKRWYQCEQPLMLLALFLHPLHVHVAVAINKEASKLRFLERLCGYGIYYYRRYFESEEVEGLAADFHAWYRGIFVDSSLVQFNGNVGQFWSFAGDIRHDSKLPKLAAVVLSIAVNTATCERYFSELAAIHTARKNRMDPDKARKFSLIRQAIRLLDEPADGTKDNVEIRRIVVADERKGVGNCNPHQETPSSDTTEFWHEIFEVLRVDEDQGGSGLRAECVDESEGEEAEILRDKELEQYVFNGFDEVIPEPDTSEFPQTNVKTFPQETKLTGLRGQKFSLMTIFPSESTFGLAPYLTTFET
ncbi:hypothetical protein PHPALM_29402 [Phytophthora palmivora]|uniref:HAT C-terminal dimerisation domain-containing protein n=1 Tax=Phytophthora palmivora TaxID=4796 RepID=A0A2P4X7N5_9STRA|nr:hypothetical protein PHPALM_29402 [Phytophthora palmivora]